MRLPEHTKSWFDVIALVCDLRIKAARSEAVAAAMTEATVAALGELRSTRSELLISRLSSRLELSPEEELAAWCLVASQLAPIVAARLEALSGGLDVTLGALASVAYDDAPGKAIAELRQDGRLSRYGLVEISDDSRLGWTRRTVRASDRLVELALTTSEAPDPSVTRLAGSRLDLRPSSELAIDPDMIAKVRAAIDACCTVVVSGLPGLGRRTLLASVANDSQLQLIEIDARRLAREPLAARVQLRAAARECRLLARVPLLANIDTLSEEILDVCQRDLFAGVDGCLLITSGLNRPALRDGRPTVAIELGQPGFAQRAALWHTELGRGTVADAEHLAATYPLAPSMIHHASRATIAHAGDRVLEPDDIRAGIRAVLDDRLGRHARRVPVTQTWDDLVLPNDQIDLIVEMLSRVRERRRVYEDWGFAAKVGRGLGVSALLSGPPGTGKTMVAALVARELGIELYQVDLAKLVSKYIGETEKHLGELFDAAEAGHAILLFDEADALFGKRSEVKSSNDRYANLETNYLLQRLETFTGVCILTSNDEANIDPAFQRRLSVHVRFEMPDETERARLWSVMFPTRAPVGAIDPTRLAHRYAMSGGYIRNAVLRAAFLAADEGTQLTQQHLERAARIEYESIGKIAA